MNYKIIDLNSYNRMEHFAFYNENVPCSFEIAFKLNISKFYKFIKRENIKFYPSFVYFVSKNINHFDEFKLMINDKNELICFDYVHPSYTIFNDKTKTFNITYTKYNENFDEFVKYFNEDYTSALNSNKLFVKGHMDNLYNISSIPWINFENFSLHLPNKKSHFFPIITNGKIIKEKTNTFIKISINVNHASADAYHVSSFLNLLQKDLLNF